MEDDFARTVTLVREELCRIINEAKRFQTVVEAWQALTAIRRFADKHAGEAPMWRNESWACEAFALNSKFAPIEDENTEGDHGCN